jgi:cytochrome c oxidase subunit 3
MVLAVDAAQKGNNKACGNRCIITILLAFVFFGIKYVEWTTKFAHGISPSTHIFWGLYFTMTGIHAFHVLVGIGLIAWLWALSKKNRFSTTYYTPVEVIGLYWHLVDVIWIFLFPLLYLLAGTGAGAH